jgi:hypothetical protein
MTQRIPMLLFGAILALAAVGQASAQVRPQDQMQTNNKNVLSGQTIAILVPMPTSVGEKSRNYMVLASNCG